MLAELVDVVIGVDTHKHTHTAAVVVSTTGAVVEELTVVTDPDGYSDLVAMAEQHSGLRAWSIEGTGGYGAGLARFLADRDELVIESTAPTVRPAETVQSPTLSTRSGPAVRHWPVTIWPSHAPRVIAQPWPCC